ncbi:Rne/Rng family ribonuclease [Paracoccus zhejiangensis]|uniref:Ribonuclease E n=1 Tax=Paracoccus zhejiangensis TaxID=1077935 RepID=A0A2H5F1M8_9RHOB|nr:ribonuclease E/G [Paracoccus zhejiangensis]AUH65450.1 ribonuclease E/G [Paracoccus zhejiangensis]
MAKKMLIDATHAEETRVVVSDGTKVEEFDFETINKRQLAGNIYLAKVTRVEPSLQAAFVDYGGNRHGFLAFAEIHPDYYQIPAADRQALLAEERVYAEAQADEETAKAAKSKSRRRGKTRAESNRSTDESVSSDQIAGMDVIDVEEADTLLEGETATDSDDDAAEVHAAVELDRAEGDEIHGEPAREEGEDAPASASEKDSEIESIAEEDVTEEIRAPRKPRQRRYKIQEVIKVRQIMLVQVVKEERGNKGAALTTYLSLAGRYCVLMPNTARGGGISRKITVAADRKKLKEIASELSVPQGAGLIIRTAGSQRTKTEIRRDYEYLMRLWEQIRELTFKSIAPAPVYEEGDLIKRTIRDLYSKDIDEVLVEGERGYRTAKDFMKMIMPSHAKNVKHYTDQMPLFARFQVESYLGGMFNPTVQLKSGGYIVIGVTEALVAIDVNSGRATKEGSIEDTATKTNLEAADEIARQLRLRDLAGLIVIDFIDMEERKNNSAVEKRLKDKLKSDRARIQVGKISGFGLLEMSRQRLRPGMLESTTQPCAHCHGTGLIRSDDSLALTILRAVEEEGTRKRSREVLIKAPIAVANFLMNGKREHIGMIETRYGMSVRVEADPSLISPDYTLEKFKTATRFVPEVESQAVSVNAQLMAQIDDDADQVEDEDEDEVVETSASEPRDENGSDDDQGRGKRRRRRRRRKPGDRAEQENGSDAATEDSDGEEAGEAVIAVAEDGEAEAADEADAEPAKKPRKSRSRSRRKGDAKDKAEEAAAVAEVDVVAEAEGESQPEVMADVVAEAVVAEESVVVAEVAVEPAPEAEVEAAPQPQPVLQEVPATEPEAAPEPELADAEPAEAEPEKPARPKRRGWWSLGR